MQAITFLSVALVAVFTKGMLQRLLILLGLIVASVIYAILTNGLGLGKPIDFSGIANAAWFGMPNFSAPVFEANAMLLIAPVAVILVAENLGHIKAVTAMTGKNLDKYMGRAFMGDGVATIVAGSTGGTGVTTYAENIGVMAATKIYSTAIFVVAGLMAIVLGFSPKFGALIQTIPLPVMGGVSIVVFGLIAIAGAKIWVDNRVDFSDNKNLLVAAITLILGTGEYTLHFGQFALGGIGTATFGAILLHALLSRKASTARARVKPCRSRGRAFFHALAFPIHVLPTVHAVEHAREHEHQVRQTVEVLARRFFDRLFVAQGHHRAFGAACHGAAHMGQTGRSRTGGQDELFELGQLAVVVFQRLVERSHGFGLEQLKTRDGQLAAQIEELVLHLDQHVAHLGGHVLAQQNTDVGVELIDLAHGVHTQAVFRHAGVVAQARGASVAGAGGDLCESVAHLVLLSVFADNGPLSDHRSRP
jgi:hypothetical protein